MKPADTSDVVDAAFDRWLRTGLRARYGAVAAAPVPRDLVRLTHGHPGARRATPAAPPRRPWAVEDSDPIRGLVVAFVLSGLFWTAVAVVVRTFWI